MVRFFILAILISSFVATAYADVSYRRLVNFEWEAIEGASSYDVELTYIRPDNTPGQKYNFTLKTAEWSGKLTPGKYQMILRALDSRKVPGEWSDPSDFFVGLDPIKITSPSNNSDIQSLNNLEQNVIFSWENVPGADSYEFSLSDSNDKVLATEVLKETKYEFKLPVASQYKWKVKAKTAKGIESDGTSIANFTVIGPKIAAPSISKPENTFVRNLNWENAEFTSNNDVALFKFNNEKRKWEKFKIFNDAKESNLSFDSDWTGGKYQVWVRGKSPLRQTSDYSKVTFDVQSGNRSPAAEYTSLVRKSIERFTGWYGIASYLLTVIQYQGVNPESASSVGYNAIGGTGRLGVGWYLPEQKWGFLGIADLSGFTINNKTNTYPSLEGSAVYKDSVGERGEIRIHLGGFYKELPETIGDPFTSTSISSRIKSIGPHIGGEYWYSLSPKFGIQINAHGYLSMLKVETPNGQALENTFSTQFGFLGSYRLSSRITGLVGYARREDKMAYKAAPTASNFAVEGDVNTSTVIGDYLNFFAEYNF